jgi:hypothetical protein
MKPRHLIPALACALLIAYPLSAGPAAWACFRYNPPKNPPALVAFYRPLAVLCERVPFISQVMSRYLELWIRPKTVFSE